MSLIAEFGLHPREDDEGLFSRNLDGQLVRLDAPTEDDYSTLVRVSVDGRSVQVPMSEPLKDSQGNIVLDLDGRTTPRHTTIFDAVAKLNAERKDGEKEISIPILCHQPHMTPVAVCRMCMVQIYGTRHGKRSAERKLLPACQHQVKEGMEVFTIEDPGPDGERVRQAVGIVTELLIADHLNHSGSSSASTSDEALMPFNELKQIGDRCGLSRSRFSQDLLAKGSAPPPKVEPPVGRRTLDTSSPVFLVDHSSCILCERCIRACNEVKNNQVIGRTGKGRSAGIGFDLNDKMLESSCVQCGECMVSCPTSAITFNPLGVVQLETGPGAEVVPLTELKNDPLFAGVPAKFLLWQKGLVLRRHLKAGDVLCREGEPGHSAFLIKRGRLQVTQRGGARVTPSSDRGNVPPPWRTPADVIVGEMACLSGTPRTADVTSLDEGEVWEVRRNVLDRIMRSPTQRAVFERLYRDRALATALHKSELFRGLQGDDEYPRSLDFLGSQISFVRVNPGQVIFRQGDMADNLYLIRLGNVRVGISRYGREATVFYQGPGTVIGEIGMLAISRKVAHKPLDEVDRALGAALADAAGLGDAAAFPPGKRTATCTALDHVEMAKIDRNAFLTMVRQFPKLRRNLTQMALTRLKSRDTPEVNQFVEQGLYQGQSLLTLDLTKCTRCDECTKACVQEHGTSSHGQPLTRLLREGVRFGDFLVATACRSCKDAYCMIGCPVDAIHRGRHQQIVIEDHCIGCGLCERNCPYGNISMHSNLQDLMNADDPKHPGHSHVVARAKAATCDLCDADGVHSEPTPRCVYACPHDAAHRMTGEQLLSAVIREAQNWAG